MLLNESRAQELMRSGGVDAVVGTTAENNYYLAGLWTLALDIFPRSAQVYTLVTAGALAEPHIVLPVSDADYLLECFVELKEVFPYGTFHREVVGEMELGAIDRNFHKLTADRQPYKDAISALTDSIKKCRLSSGCLAIDEGAFNADYFEQLALHFPNLKVVPGAKLLQDIRAVKTAEEVRRLKETVQITERAITESLSILKEGVSEYELLIAFRKSVVGQGALPYFALINFGTNTALGNITTVERELQKGDVIRFDVGCRYDGYVSDISRIFCLGDPGHKARNYYEALRKGNEKGITSIKPGVTAKSVFETIVNTVRESGLPHYRRHHTGHGIGLEVYEPPLIGPEADQVIESGMTFAIEAPYYELGFAGLQVEDIIQVTDHGIEYLSKLSRDLVILD